MRKVTIYHNDECRFMPYEDRQLLIAVTSHWLDDAVAVNDAQAVADWAFHVFNADLDMLEPSRDTAGGETTFLAGCVYRLLGYRSLSVGDVIEVTSGDDTVWLACESFGWRAIAEPTNRSGQALTAAAVYQSMAARRSTR